MYPQSRVKRVCTFHVNLCSVFTTRDNGSLIIIGHPVQYTGRDPWTEKLTSNPRSLIHRSFFSRGRLKGTLYGGIEVWLDALMFDIDLDG